MPRPIRSGYRFTGQSWPEPFPAGTASHGAGAITTGAARAAIDREEATGAHDARIQCSHFMLKCSRRRAAG